MEYLDKFIELARKLSLNSNHKQHHLGCVITKKNKIISMGWNKTKTHPKSTARFHMLHAEIDALLGLSLQDTRGCTAYIYRENKAGKLAMARPCDGCELALKQAGIKKIIYTYDNGILQEKI